MVQGFEGIKALLVAEAVNKAQGECFAVCVALKTEQMGLNRDLIAIVKGRAEADIKHRGIGFAPDFCKNGINAAPGQTFLGVIRLQVGRRKAQVAPDMVPLDDVPFQIVAPSETGIDAGDVAGL